MKSILKTICFIVLLSIQLFHLCNTNETTPSAPILEEENVLVLTDDNFDQVIAEHQHILVEFYAPWCGHCKNLAPEYAAAATTLSKLTPRIYLAKIDAEKNEKTAAKYKIEGYPDIRLFAHGTPSEYDGGHSEKDLVSFMRKKTGPVHTELKSVEEVEKFISNKELVAVFFGENSDLIKLFITYAETATNIEFANCSTEECKTHYKVQNGNIVLFKKFDNPRVDFTVENWKMDQLASFLNRNSVPLVAKYNEKIAQNILGRNIPCIFFFRNKSAEKDELANRMALSLKDEHNIQTVVASTDSSENEDEEKIVEDLDLDAKTSLAVAIIDTTDGLLKKYRMESEVNADNIIKFLEDWKNKKLERYIKSEPIPESQNEPVTVVVAKNYDTIVNDPTKDVLLEFYAPWCGHCQELAPIYKNLAEILKVNNPNIVIAKIDGTKNDYDTVVEGFPYIVLYPSNKKTAIEFDGERDLPTFVEFLQKNAPLFKMHDDLKNLPKPDTKDDAKDDEDLEPETDETQNDEDKEGEKAESNQEMEEISKDNVEQHEENLKNVEPTKQDL